LDAKNELLMICNFHVHFVKLHVQKLPKYGVKEQPKFKFAEMTAGIKQVC